MPRPIIAVQRQPRRTRLLLLVLLMAAATAVALLLIQAAGAEKLDQPYITDEAGNSAVECDPHGFEVDADVDVGNVPNATGPGADSRDDCPGHDWSRDDATAGAAGQQAMFIQTGFPDAADCGGNNVNNGLPINRNPNFPNSAFGCDDLALSSLTDCTTHTQGDKVTDGTYHIVKGGAQPKADIENFYAVILPGTPPTVIVGLERVTNNGDTHLNVAFKQGGSIITPSECNPSDAGRSSGWTAGDLIANVNYGGGTTQPEISIFEVFAVDGFGNATLCIAAGTDPDGSIPNCGGFPSVDTLGLTNCDVVQVNQQFRCGGSADKAEAENSNILAGFWQATVCEGTQDNPKGNSAGCRLTSSFAPTAAPGNGDPETLRPQRTFVEVRLTSGLLDTCFATLQVQSRSSGESVTSAASDISEAAFPGCSLEWEKRDDQGVLQGGATFEVLGDAGNADPGGLGTEDGIFACLTTVDVNPVTVVDNVGAMGTFLDQDPDPGQFQLVGICEGTYTITETIAPSGFAIDTDFDRVVVIGTGAQNVVVGAQDTDDVSTDIATLCGQGQTDECDFHNRLGTLEWEKRDASQTNHPLQGDATFTVLGAATNNPSNVQDGPFACHDTDSDSGDEDNPVTVTDNDALDQDPTAGQIKLSRVCLGDYTITETAAPSGYAVDDDPNREISVTGGALNPTVGTDFSATDTGVDDDSRSPHATGDCGAEDCDFHNRRGTLVIRKEGKDASRTVTDDLLGGATFTITPNPFTGSSTGLDVTDDQNSGGVVDQYLTDGMICLDGVQLDSYAIVEKTAPPNYSKDTRTENVTVSTSSSCAARLAAATAQLEQNVDEDALFDNIPLSQIEIIFTSLAGVGITQLEIPIVCATPTAAGVDVLDTDADPENDDAVLDRAEVFTDLLPGTYVCTIVIDP